MRDLAQNLPVLPEGLAVSAAVLPLADELKKQNAEARAIGQQIGEAQAASRTAAAADMAARVAAERAGRKQPGNVATERNEALLKELRIQAEVKSHVVDEINKDAERLVNSQADGWAPEVRTALKAAAERRRAAVAEVGAALTEEANLTILLAWCESHGNAKAVPFFPTVKALSGRDGEPGPRADVVVAALAALDDPVKPFPPKPDPDAPKRGLRPLIFNSPVDTADSIHIGLPARPVRT